MSKRQTSNLKQSSLTSFFTSSTATKKNGVNQGKDEYRDVDIGNEDPSSPINKEGGSQTNKTKPKPSSPDTKKKSNVDEVVEKPKTSKKPASTRAKKDSSLATKKTSSSPSLSSKKKVTPKKGESEEENYYNSDDDNEGQKKQSSSTTTVTTTSTSSSGRRRTITKNIDLVLDSDSEDEKYLLKKRKKRDSDDDYDPDKDGSEEDESLSEDDGFIVNGEEESDEDMRQDGMSEDEDILASINSTTTTTQSSSSSSSSMSFSSQTDGPRVVISNRVSLPPGTPTFTNDVKAKNKLLKSIDTMEKIKSDARAAAQKELEGTTEGEGDADDEEEEAEKKKKSAPATAKGKSKASAKVKYTPLEQQYIDIKKQYPDTVLMVECGYKYKFFGNDAEVANKVLNIYSYVAKNFLNASIPTQRLYHHLRRLVHAGYKVGVVEQVETAALKAASDSKSGPFERKLTRLYTSSTFIDDDVESASTDFSNISPNYLVAFYESSPQTKKQQAPQPQKSPISMAVEQQQIKSPTTSISFVAISISTGDIIYDTFDDDLLRSNLETRLTHLRPTEILLPPECKSKQDDGTDQITYSKFTRLTSKTIKNYCKTNNVRIQLMSEELYDVDLSISKLAALYDQFESSDAKEDAYSTVLSLQQQQLVCLQVLTSYLKDFNQFNSILKVSSNFKPFKVSNHLILPRSTIENLEILENEDTKNEKGSLYWVMNRTQTIAGKRLFLNWICKPLTDLSLIKERQEAVIELVNCIKERVKSTELIGDFLKSSIPDLQRNLSKVFYKSQCQPKDFLSTMKSFQRLSTLFTNVSSLDQFKSSKLLKELFGNDQVSGERIQKFRNKVESALSSISHEQANLNCRENIWTDDKMYPRLTETKGEIDNIDKELNQYLKQIKKDVNKPSLEYLHQPKNHLEYLLELPVAFKAVPKDWIKVNGTQKVSRYQTPFITEKLKLLAQNRERLTLLAKEAWLDFLGKIGNDYTLYTSMINKLALLDCLVSLAKLAMTPGYVLPNMTSEPGINVVQGRHPIVENTLSQTGGSYVPNSLNLSSSGERAMIITGPNMGGKSSFIRQTSLIVIMAQMGSFVPADSCTMGVFDAIYTRMGARDIIEQGSSTFFVELQETSQILQEATPRSLVILDELGRGTSTHDGVSIAYSSLLYIVEKLKCFCLFVTHYPLLAQIENMYPNNVSNYHMSFIEEEQKSINGVQQQPKVIFLYKVVRGAAKNSYGINVATLANVPDQVIRSAVLKSNELKQSITNKVFSSTKAPDQYKQIIQQIKELTINNNGNQQERLEKLRLLQQSLLEDVKQ